LAARQISGRRRVADGTAHGGNGISQPCRRIDRRRSLICASAQAFAQKNEGMGVVAPSKPILKDLKEEMDAAAPAPPGSAPTTSSPPKTRAPKAKKSDPADLK
jgi:hypothetical protein